MTHRLVTASHLLLSRPVLCKGRRAGVMGEVVLAVMRQATVHAPIPMLAASLLFLAIKGQDE